MSDLIKEFKMTDLLGMMMPGSLVVLLFGWEFGLWDYMSGRTVFPKGDGFLTVLVLVTGYAAGMLIHELADILEKFLWRNPVVDPRTQAVAASGYILPDNNSNSQQPQSDQQDDLKKDILCTLFIFVLLGAAIVIAFGTQENIIQSVFVGIVAGVVFCFFFWYVMDQRLINICKQYDGDLKKNKASVMLARQNNDVLTYHYQAHVYGSEEYERMVLRKHDLFDGFRTMARNTFLTILLLCDYGAMTNGALAALYIKGRNNPKVLSLVIVVMILLAVRFYHYTYLRYKYIYEDAAMPMRSVQNEPSN